MLSLLKKFACSAKDVDVSSNKKRKGKNIEEKNDAPVYHEVDIRKHYDIKGLIGFPGSYGEVRAAVDVKTGKPYAIKMMTIQKHTENLIKAEIDIMKMLHHDNCAEIHAVYYMKKKVYIVMEKYDGGDLFDLVATKGGRFKDEKEAAQLMKQILQALVYVHSMKIAHCDVKLCNILLTADSKVKLIDFGVSQIVEDKEMLHHEVGSPSFIAPEVIMGSYNERCDMWSLGCVAFILMFGFNPFNPKAMPALANKQKICETILKGFSSEVKAGYGAWFPEKVPVSDSFKEFVSALLTTEWKDRLTAEEALQHPWIVDNCS